MNKISLSISGVPIETNGVPTGGLSEVAKIIQTVIALAFLLAVIIGLASLLYSGYQWMFSSGDKQKIQNARQRLTFTIVGLALVFVALLVINVIGTFFGIDNILTLPGS